MNRIMQGWEVEWISEMPVVPGTNDADVDRATYHYRDFATEREALIFGRILTTKDIYGPPRLTRFHLELLVEDEPLAGYTKEYDGETVEIS